MNVKLPNRDRFCIKGYGSDVIGDKRLRSEGSEKKRKVGSAMNYTVTTLVNLLISNVLYSTRLRTLSLSQYDKGLTAFKWHFDIGSVSYISRVYATSYLPVEFLSFVER